MRCSLSLLEGAEEALPPRQALPGRGRGGGEGRGLLWQRDSSDRGGGGGAEMVHAVASLFGEQEERQLSRSASFRLTASSFGSVASSHPARRSARWTLFPAAWHLASPR